MVRANMPSKKQIRDFWATRLVMEGKLDSPRNEWFLQDACFACHNLWQIGQTTERSHILANCEGGVETVENLHLLCDACHKDSEMLSGQDYWDWFYKRSDMDGILSTMLLTVNGRKAMIDLFKTGFNKGNP